MIEKEDIKLFKSVACFYGAVKTIPYVRKYILVALIIFHLFSIVCFINVYAESIKPVDICIIGFLIYVSYLLLTIIFGLVCLKSAYNQEDLWNSFFSDVETFDFKINDQKDIPQESVYKYYLKFVLGNIFLIIFYVFKYYLSLFSSSYQLIIAIIYSYFVSSQVLATTLLLEKILQLFVSVMIF